MSAFGGKTEMTRTRFVEGKLDRFPALISDLVQRKVAVLVISTPQGSNLDWIGANGEHDRDLSRRPFCSQGDLYRASISLEEI